MREQIIERTKLEIKGFMGRSSPGESADLGVSSRRIVVLNAKASSWTRIRFLGQVRRLDRPLPEMMVAEGAQYHFQGRKYITYRSRVEGAIPLHYQLRTPWIDLGLYSNRPEDIHFVSVALGITQPKLQNQHAQVALRLVHEGALETGMGW